MTDKENETESHSWHPLSHPKAYIDEELLFAEQLHPFQHQKNVPQLQTAVASLQKLRQEAPLLQQVLHVCSASAWCSFFAWLELLLSCEALPEVQLSSGVPRVG